MAEIKLNISGMKCGGCVASVEQALQAQAGVESVEISLENASAVITGQVDAGVLARAVSDAGFPAEPA
jgi:Cu+-exporting ATPase